MNTFRVHLVIPHEPPRSLLDAKTQDALTVPGFAATFDPDEAECMGAFEESALSEDDVLESATDLLRQHT